MLVTKLNIKIAVDSLIRVMRRSRAESVATSRWAALIQKVYEIDPMKCPKYGNVMHIIAFIENRNQPDVVKKILKHCNLWKDPEPRASPKFKLKHEYIPIDQFLADF